MKSFIIKRKFVSLCLVLAFVFVAVTACGGGYTETPEQAQPQEQIPEQTQPPEQVPEQTQPPEQTPEPPEQEPTPEPPQDQPAVYEDPPEYIYIPQTDPDAISFETGTYGFAGRGAASVTRTQEEARSGEYSLLATGRTSSWHGILVDVTDSAVAGAEYEFALWVKPVGQQVTFQLSAEFVYGGQTAWRQLVGPLANVTARPGEWTLMRGSMVFYPFDRVSVYIETNAAGAEADFFIDDVIFRELHFEYVMENRPSLHEAYADYFIFGVAVVPMDMRGPRFEFVRHHFNAITAGNDMKPDALQRQPGVFTFGVADSMVQTTLDNNMYKIGHTLVWHNQSPAWMNEPGISREQAIENLETHITEVVSRYAGQILVWDVVNEAFPSWIHANDNPRDWRRHLRQTPWLEAIGYEYIEIAFRAAHAADPTAKLIYNDYNLDAVGKREAVHAMIEELLERGVPIHGVGMQGHYNLNTRPLDVENSILRFAELGISVSITELDITAQGALGYEIMPHRYELAQAILYARLFTIFREHHELIHRVTLWGIDDTHSWRSDRFPLPFNRDLTAKLAYFAILDPEGFLLELE